MMNSNFTDYKLSEDLLKSIGMLNYKTLTKVQQEVIPSILEEKDVIVKSQTGSGKTAAFGIPICELVNWYENKPQALVLAPTRELAIQVKDDMFNLGRFKRLKVVAIYGKSPFYHQVKELKQKTHVVVGTPGRIIDHIERGTLDPSTIKYLVLDEADEMLSMGFLEQIEVILKSLSKERVTMLFSATMPKDMEDLCTKHLKNPVRVEIEEEDPVAERIVQERYEVAQKDKLELLRDITILENPDSCIIFCNTKQRVDMLYQELENMGYTSNKLHGGMEQRDRLRVMNDFKKGTFRYLVATDIAARGIDIDCISLVINYDLPREKERYVHRIGRTGRISREGRSITFVEKEESSILREIQRYSGKEMILKERPAPETLDHLREEFLIKTNTTPEIKKTKGEELNKEILKLHINAGKKTKMRPADIVGTLCRIEGMTAEDIGIIHIVDLSTFVEILNNKGELVYGELQMKPIKGRLRKVTKVYPS
jgi:ATP-dependent RNA helicase DeaD